MSRGPLSVRELEGLHTRGVPSFPHVTPRPGDLPRRPPRGGPAHVVYMLDWSLAGGRAYIGKTAGLDRRLREHSRGRLLAVWRKHGPPAVTVLHRCALRSEAFILEPWEIHQRRTLAPGGYNLAPGAEGRTVAEVRAWATHPDFRKLSPAAHAAWEWFVAGEMRNRETPKPCETR